MINHIAFIMDGNRRWAKRQGLLPFLGHNKGAQTIQHVVEFCLKNNIKYSSLYAFSLENFNRSAQEITYLFDLLINEAHKKLPVFLENNIKVRFIGDRSLFPAKIMATAQDMEEKTANCSALNLNFLFCYGATKKLWPQ